MVTRRAGASAAVLLLLVAGACGGGKDDKVASGATTTAAADAATSTSTTAKATANTDKASATTVTTAAGTAADPRTKAQLAADTALAKRANLVAGDLPAGWTASTDDDSDDSADDSSDDADNAAMAKCLGTDPSFLDDSAVDESSDEFDNEDATVSSEIEVAPTAAEATRQFGILAGPKFLGCYEAFVTKAFQAGADDPDEGAPGMAIGKVTASTFAFPSLGDQSLAIRVTVPFSYAGQSFSMDLDTVFIRVGRAEVTMGYSNINAPNDHSVAQATARTVVNRLASA